MLDDTTELQVLHDFDYYLDDDDIYSIELLYDDDDQPILNVFHGNPNKYQGSKVITVNLKSRELNIKVLFVEGEQITSDIAGPEDVSLSEIRDGEEHIGLGGLKISLENGYWGTSTMSASSIDISTQSQRCRGKNGILISNSHVLDKVGKKIFNRNGVFIGKTGCVFDLNGKHPIDFGYANWTSNVHNNNKFKVFDSRNGALIPIKGMRTIGTGRTIDKHGARTGWSSGKVKARARIKVNGYKGRFDCFRGSYKSDSGDSGSPILRKHRGAWWLVGVNFASGPHFWGFDQTSMLQDKEEQAFVL